MRRVYQQEYRCRIRLYDAAVVTGAAIGEGDLQAGMLAELFRILGYLDGEFSGGCKDENAGLARLVASAIFLGFVQDMLDARNEEGGGLARTVCACPATSLPPSAIGKVSAWMGVAHSKPASRIPACKVSSRSKESNLRSLRWLSVI